MSGSPPTVRRLARGQTPWHALQGLARLLYGEREDQQAGAGFADRQIEVRLMDAAGIDPNGGWLAEAVWTRKP